MQNAGARYDDPKGYRSLPATVSEREWNCMSLTHMSMEAGARPISARGTAVAK